MYLEPPPPEECAPLGVPPSLGSRFWRDSREPKDQTNSRFRARLEISSENEIFERATHHGPCFFFVGEIETSRLEFSSEINQKQKISPKRKFWDGCPCGHPAQNFGQALQFLETKKKNKHFRTDAPRRRPRESFGRADFSFPN